MGVLFWENALLPSPSSRFLGPSPPRPPPAPPASPLRLSRHRCCSRRNSPDPLGYLWPSLQFRSNLLTPLCLLSPTPKKGERAGELSVFLAQRQSQRSGGCSVVFRFSRSAVRTSPFRPLPSARHRRFPAACLTVLCARGSGYQEGFSGVALLGLGVPEELGVDGLRRPGLRGLLAHPRPPRR